MAINANNPLNTPGIVHLWTDQGKLNITVGGPHGLDHSHTVISPNGQILYDRDAYRNTIVGNANQRPLLPPGGTIPGWKG